MLNVCTRLLFVISKKAGLLFWSEDTWFGHKGVESSKGSHAESATRATATVQLLY